MSESKWTGFLALVLTVPLLVYYNYQPVASVFNDASALVLWGLFAALLLVRSQQSTKKAASQNFGLLKDLLRGLLARTNLRVIFSPAGSFLLLLICLLWWCVQVLRGDYGFLSYVATLFAAATAGWIVFLAGHVWAESPGRERSDGGFALALMIMGVVVGAVGWIQYLTPGMFEPWINPLLTPGRVYGNIRQPNHLALVLAWSVWGIVWWASHNSKAWIPATAALLFVVPVLAFTGSRMVRVFLVVIVVLAILAPMRKRALAFSLGAVAAYVAAWWAAAWWALNGAGPAFFGLDRIGVSDSTGGRAELWAQVLELLPQIPWYGCGPGQFNFCWTHGVLNSRVEGTLAHAHNFVLNSIVEWGWPLTVVVVGWVFASLYCFLRHGRGTVAALPAGLVMATLCHAMLEFPLVYPYLLLPAAFALGWMWTASEIAASGESLGQKAQISGDAGTGYRSDDKTPWLGAGLGLIVVLFGVVYAAQYWSLRSFFRPEIGEVQSAESIQRVVQGARLFSAIPSYGLAMSVTESVRPEDAGAMLPYLRLAGRGLVGADFLARFAMVAALDGRSEMAKHLAWRAVQMSPGGRQSQLEVVENSEEPLFQELRAYLAHPYPVNLSPEQFKNR